MASKSGTSRTKQLTFRYLKDPGYRLVPINGVWGGITPRGEIHMELFHESQAPPEVVVRSLTPKGGLGEEVDHQPPREISRTILVGVMLTEESAESMANWLHARVRQLRERNEKKKKRGDQQ